MLENWLKNIEELQQGHWKSLIQEGHKYLHIFDKSHCYLRAGPKVEVSSPSPNVGFVPQQLSEATLFPKA